MNLLLIGGTSFVGRAIALAAVDRGHAVTVLNRGVTHSDLPPSVRRLIGDRRGDLGVLQGEQFDATIDAIAYRPSEVEALAQALGGRGGHHLQISSVSAYLEPPRPGMAEAELDLSPDDAVDPEAPIDAATYGPLKAAAERAARQHFGTDTMVLRPTFVLGSHDATLRYPYWVDRLGRGGQVAVPGPLRNAAQWIDARDLGAFAVHCVETQQRGAVQVTAPSSSFGQFLADTAGALSAEVEFCEVPASVVLERKMASSFPLWAGPTGSAALALDPSAALEAGLEVRPLADTALDTAAWCKTLERPAHWLDAAAERELLGQVDPG